MRQIRDAQRPCRTPRLTSTSVCGPLEQFDDKQKMRHHLNCSYEWISRRAVFPDRFSPATTSLDQTVFSISFAA